MEIQQTDRVKHIDYMKACAIILVVLGHAITYQWNEKDCELGIRIAIELIYAVHVPLFFVIAGFLCHPKEWRGYIQGKIFRLLIPYYVFASLKILYSIVVSSDFSHTSTLVGQIIELIFYGTSYWFCYSLFEMYLLAPVFWKKDIRMFSEVIIVLVIFNTIISSMRIEITNMFQIGKTIYYIIFFIFGMSLVAEKERLKRCELYFNNKKIVILLCILVTITILYFRLNGNDWIPLKIIFSLSLILLVYFVALELEKSNCRIFDKSLNIISKYSLQIMLLDAFLKVVLFELLGRLFEMSIVIVILAAAVNIAFACIICKFIERIPFMKILFGLK